jgi:hypothetical protein
MFSLYENCLFCFSELPDPSQRRGQGEHVIPRNIYGFWKSQDICDSCKRYFGLKVDNLALKNAELVKAITELNLPNIDSVLDSHAYQAKDTINDSKVKMVRKKGKFKIKVTKTKNHFFECAEEDWPKIGLEWIRSTAPTSFPIEVIETEIRNLEEQYKKLKPGETVRSDKLGITVRKRQVRGVEFDTSSFLSISPLIAKIAVCFLYYCLSPEELEKIKEVEMLRSHARHSKPIDNYVINWFPPIKKTPYYRWHRITLEPFGKTLLLDITLFGYPNWRIIATSEDKLSVKYRNGQPVRMLYLVFDFSDFLDKKKYLGFKYQDNNQIEWYDLFK